MFFAQTDKFETKFTEAISNIEQMYSNQWTTLLLIIVSFLTFVGILIPILLGLLQRRTINLSEKELEEKMDDKFKKLSEKNEGEIEAQRKTMAEDFNAAKKEFGEQLAEKEKELEEKIQQVRYRASGATLHVQGSARLREGRFVIAAQSFVEAAYLYIQANDEPNFQRVMLSLVEDTLPKMNKTDLKILDDLEPDLDDLVIEIEEFNENSRYENLLGNFRRAFRQCREREPEQESESEGASESPATRPM